MKLYSGHLSVFGMKAEIAAFEKGLAVDVELVPSSIAEGYEPKHPEVVRVNPKREVPVLIDGDLELFDSTQIFEYFEALRPEPALWPAEPRARARARLLELTIDEIFFPNVVQLFPKNRAASGEAVAEHALAAIHASYYDFERRLEKQGRFLLGSFTYADITLLAAQFMAEAVGATLPAALERLQAWREGLLKRPSAQPIARAVDYLKSAGLVLSSYARLVS